MQNKNENPAIEVAATAIAGNHADIRQAALALGLKPVQAYLPDEAAKKQRSAGAERTKRAREKAQAQGVKQVSISLPVELHEKVRELSRRTRAGEEADTVWAELGPPATAAKPAESLPSPPLLELLQALPSWRRWLLRLLAGNALGRDSSAQEKNCATGQKLRKQ